MMHFIKNEDTLRRFCVELISAYHQLMNLKKVEVDMEAAIFNGFQSIICKSLELYCKQHLHQRDEKAIDSSHQKSSIADTRFLVWYIEERIWDIYRKCTYDIFEKGINDPTNSDLCGKCLSVEPRWEKLCPGFYNWSLTHSRKKFHQCQPVCERRYGCSQSVLPEWYRVTSCHWETHSVLYDGQCLGGIQHHQDPDRMQIKWNSVSSVWWR